MTTDSDLSITDMLAQVHQFTNAPIWMIIAVFLVALGYVIKGIPKIPNWTISIVCVVSGTALLPLLAPRMALPMTQSHPAVVFALMGFILGVASWGAHGTVLTFIEKKLGYNFDFDSSATLTNPGRLETVQRTSLGASLAPTQAAAATLPLTPNPSLTRDRTINP